MSVNKDENRNQNNNNSNNNSNNNPDISAPERNQLPPARRNPGNSVVPSNPSQPPNPSPPSNISSHAGPPKPSKPAPPKPAHVAKPQNPQNRPANKPGKSNEPQAGHTRTFNTNRNMNIPREKPGRANQDQARRGQQQRRQVREDGYARNSGDGTYSLTGRNIKSSRQRVRADNYDEGVTVSRGRDKAGKKSKNDDVETKRGGFLVSGILKVVLYIVGVIAISGILAYNIIMIANDVFAFVKEDITTNVIIPENADIEQISQILHENALIKYPKIFDFYINYRRKDNLWEFEPGIYTVSSTMNYDELIWEFRKKPGEREIVRITIREGLTIDQIIDVFVDENKIGSRAKFEDVLNNYDFAQHGYRFLKPLYENKDRLSQDRKYILEGYLFPDTYEFYQDENEINIIMKFLNNFNAKFPEEFYKQTELLSEAYEKTVGKEISIDDIINLAAMIEREGRFRDDLPKISAVFHNRLLNPSAYPFLQSDATIIYSYGVHKSDLTQADLEEDLPYNTYTRRGLPPSAICNPGYESIHAALYPEEEFPFYYFITDLSGWAHYSQTLAEHEAHRVRIRGEREAAAAAAAQED